MPRSLGSTQGPGSGRASEDVRVHDRASPEVATGIVLPLDEVPYAFQLPSPQIMDGSGKSTPITGPEKSRALRPSENSVIVMLVRLSSGKSELSSWVGRAEAMPKPRAIGRSFMVRS